MKKLIFIMGLVVISAGLFVGGFYARGYYDKQQITAAKKTANQFVHAVVGGDVASAYKFAGSNVKTNLATQDAFAKAMGDLKSTGAMYQAEVVMKKDSTVMYSQKVLNLPKNSSGSTTGTFYLSLNKEGGSWKVANIAVQ